MPVDPRLLARVEALCERAATLASEAAALSLEVARLHSAAKAMARRTGSRGPLSARQVEVAELVSAGLSNRQIAERLVVTERTVETHLERIFSRLDITSRAQLAHWIAEQEVMEHLLAFPNSGAMLRHQNDR